MGKTNRIVAVCIPERTAAATQHIYPVDPENPVILSCYFFGSENTDWLFTIA